MQANMASDGCENLYSNAARKRNGKVFAGPDGRTRMSIISAVQASGAQGTAGS
jgi:hypothetical protein